MGAGLLAAKALLGRIWPHLLIAALLGFAVWKIHQDGYNRAKREAEQRQMVNAILIKRMEARMTERLLAEMAALDRETSSRISGIDVQHRTVIQPTLEREIRSDPRFSDPAAGITDGMLRAINAARALSADDSGASAEHPPAVPAGGAAER